jgi:transposase
MAASNRTYHTTTARLCAAVSGESSPDPADEREPEGARGGASAASANERTRWQVIEMLAEGKSLAEIEARTGRRPRTIRQIAQRYREQGAAGLADGRQHSKGATPLLSAAQQRELQEALQHPALDGGVWTGPKVAQWIAARTGKPVHRQRGWEYLRRLGGTSE